MIILLANSPKIIVAYTAVVTILPTLLMILLVFAFVEIRWKNLIVMTVIVGR